jgi:hypothetical protein
MPDLEASMKTIGFTGAHPYVLIRCLVVVQETSHSGVQHN